VALMTHRVNARREQYLWTSDFRLQASSSNPRIDRICCACSVDAWARWRSSIRRDSGSPHHPRPFGDLMSARIGDATCPTTRETASCGELYDMDCLTPLG
jgi:hypothetical protein